MFGHECDAVFFGSVGGRQCGMWGARCFARFSREHALVCMSAPCVFVQLDRLSAITWEPHERLHCTRANISDVSCLTLESAVHLIVSEMGTFMLQ